MKEYYNILENGHKVFEFTAYGMFMIAVGIAAIIYSKRTEEEKFKISILYIWIAFVAVFSTTAFIISGSQYLECRKAMKHKTYKEVEGLIENFNPKSGAGGKFDSFRVKGVLFRYSDNIITAGFNQTNYRGGPIEEGKYVRVRYYQGDILQLWVKE